MTNRSRINRERQIASERDREERESEREEIDRYTDINIDERYREGGGR